MKTATKHFSLFALLVCGILAAVGCGGDDPADTSALTDTGTVAATTEAGPTDGLPDTDMQGFEFKIKHFDGSWLSWAVTLLDTEETSGDILEDAVYDRNRDTEDRFNCKIIIDSAEMIDNAEMQTVAMAGDTTYDVYFNYDLTITASIPYLMPFENLPHINLDADWWNPDATAVFRIGDKTYSAAGNFSLSVLSRAAGYEFNKQILTNLDGGDLYQMVRDGTWTLDRFCELCRLATYDLNGDGEMTVEDGLGLAGSWKEVMNRMILCSGISYIDRDENNYPVFNLPSDENAIDKLMNLYERISDMNVFYATQTRSIDGQGSIADFTKGTTLFSTGHPKSLEEHRSLDLDIGIVPCPKYDEAQERYYAPSFGAEVPVLPISLPEERWDNVGLLMEALSFASHNDVVPTYKEVVLKTKAARDDDSSDMIDIIFSSISFDFGINAWQSQLSSPLISGIYSSKTGNVASTLTKLEKNVNKEIEKLIKNIEAE